jgi:hypothetical protein
MTHLAIHRSMVCQPRGNVSPVEFEFLYVDQGVQLSNICQIGNQLNVSVEPGPAQSCDSGKLWPRRHRGSGLTIEHARLHAVAEVGG